MMSKKSKKGRAKRERSNKPLISACMIVKNEEAMLPQCLESIKDLVDEIVIVDTGSSDRTVEIAEHFGARVYHHPWQNDFSKHRNQSISYAKGDWIFIMDADEELFGKGIPHVRRAVQDENIDAVMVQIFSKLRNGRSEGVHCQERLFRSNGVIHYEGRVHNRLVGVKKARVFPIRLMHYGYDLDPEASRKKFERTVSLLNMDLEDDPENPMTYHYLGCSYLTQGMFQQSLEASMRAIELASARKDSNLIYIWSHYNAAISCYKLKNLTDAESLCLAALRKYPNHVDSHFVLSLVYFDREQWGKVISHGDEYLGLTELQERKPGAFDNLVMCSLKEKWNIGALVGMAHAELGEEEKAEEDFQRAMDWAPEPFLVARAAGIFFYNKGLLHKARSYLAKADEMPGSDQRVRELLEEIRIKIGDPEAEPSISCCMIVKNEEAFLGQCLESVKDFVDEIVIVDTGSTDGTVDIARQYTDKVYFHPWEGSFSKARNRASSYALGDWIFVIDGDEELVQGSGEKLREAARNAGDADAILVNTISTYSNGAKRARHNSERLFRNNGVICYEGIVHNRVVGARSIKVSRIEVMHYGYDLDEKKAHEKFLRTTGLLKKQIAENPGDPMPHHYLGVSYLSRGMDKEAAAESVNAVELAEQKREEHPLYIWARHNAAMAFFRLGDLDKAAEYSRDALRKYPDHLDSYYTLTMVAGERGAWKDVLSYGARFIELRDIFEKSPEKAGVVINATMNEGPAAHLLIGHAWNALGDISKMEKEYQLAADLSEHKWQAWWNAGCFHLDRTGDLEVAERYLEAALEEAPEQQEAWYMLAKLNKKKGSAEEEKRCLEKLRDLDTKDLVALNRLAKLYVESGQRDLALKVLHRSIEKDPFNYGALYHLGIVHEEDNQLEAATGFFKRALDLHPEQPDPWLHLCKISLRVGRAEEARVFVERVLGHRPHEIMALLCLCEIDLKQMRFPEFVHSCDRILAELQLNRQRVIHGLDDMVGVVEEIRSALRGRPHLGSQTEKLLSLLASHVRVFSETMKDLRAQDVEDERARPV
jgi:glycosyltransferase involved in cell wall biosynthesis